MSISHPSGCKLHKAVVFAVACGGTAEEGTGTAVDELIWSWIRNSGCPVDALMGWEGVAWMIHDGAQRVVAIQVGDHWE